MLDRHRLAHSALVLIYVVTAVMLFCDGAPSHAGCALAAALVYVLLCLPG